MDNEIRADPDALLAALRRQDAQQTRGRLKVFLGMAAGAGKTYAMLEAARKQRADGVDTVIGYLETHGRPETDALARDLPAVPRKPVVHRGVALTEMDLDAVLARRPRLVLVDELAHTNAPDSRHPKRYQDVQELLDAGVDVFTTLNVQHVLSRADTVREVTGVTVQETIPDSVLDAADIELVDISPGDLLRRLAEGRVYIAERAEAAARGFFRVGNLTALREMALRLAAEQVGQDVRDYMQARQIVGPWKSGHRLLVAVSPSPLSEPMVRWTRRLADSLDCTWIAAYVETSHILSGDEQVRLTRHLALARELGAEVRTTTDDDIVRGLLRMAQTQNVTQIVVGKPADAGGWAFWRGACRLSRLVRESGNIDVHAVRVDAGDQRARPRPWTAESGWGQYAVGALAIGAVTLVNLPLEGLVGSRSVALIYLLSVVSLALRLGRGPVLLAATLSALLWNLLFLAPRFTLYIHRFEDLMMFGMYFVVALAMGQLIARIRTRERLDRRREERATALYLLTLGLAETSTYEQIEQVAADNLGRVFQARGALLLPDGIGGWRGGSDLAEKELSTAAWALAYGKPAGRFTDTLPLAEAMYLPLRTTGDVLGILRLDWRQASPPTLDQRNLLEAFLRHIALVLDRQRLRDAEAQSRVLAESERLGRVLLDSVSHELRTPIAAIGSALSGLQDEVRSPTGQALAAEIRDATARLNHLVGNLLDMTRLETGRVHPCLDWCDVHDLLNAALARTAGELARHAVTLVAAADLPLVRVDSALLEQALANLLLNTAVHTLPGTAVQVSAEAEGRDLLIRVADRGPGLPPSALPRIFEKFYRAANAPAGGTGLGLSIVKGFVTAQGGTVEAGNRAGGGAVFTVRLPIAEPPPVCPSPEATT